MVVKRGFQAEQDLDISSHTDLATFPPPNSPGRGIFTSADFSYCLALQPIDNCLAGIFGGMTRVQGEETAFSG